MRRKGAILASMSNRNNDPARPLLNPRHEKAARAIAEGAKGLTSSDLARLVGVSKRTAESYRNDPKIVDRVTWIQRSRLKGLVPKALMTLERLLDAESEQVRLKAAIEVLDRSGYGPEQTTTETSNPFQVVFDFGGLQKPATICSSTPTPSDFLPSGTSGKAVDGAVQEGDEIDQDIQQTGSL